MNDSVLAYASLLKLTRNDVKTLNIKDAYALHKVVYGLFEDIRTQTQKNESLPSGIIYVDKGGDFQARQILILSDRKPHQTPQFGQVATKPIWSNFILHDSYGFEITLNPSRRDKNSHKVVAIRGRENIVAWAIDHAPKHWGFNINPNNLEVSNLSVQTFKKSAITVTHGVATLRGELSVIDRECFKHSFIQGIGRGRAFGFGLLQIVPLSK